MKPRAVRDVVQGTQRDGRFGPGPRDHGSGSAWEDARHTTDETASVRPSSVRRGVFQGRVFPRFTRRSLSSGGRNEKDGRVSDHSRELLPLSTTRG